MSYLFKVLSHKTFKSAIKKNYNHNHSYTQLHMSRAMRKCILYHMQTTKAQISLHIHAVWSAPLLFAA